MPLTPQPFTEHPDLRVPIAIIVDDPAPCINPLWYFRHQVDGQENPEDERVIPLDFMEEWCAFVSETGIKGDFTVLPIPAGLGRIDESLIGFDSDEVHAWTQLARDAIAPQFDIHAEILTHTNALDLATGKLMAVSEHDWTALQTEETLANYFSVAFEILAESGLPTFGVTQPCYFHGDESLYARALLAAEKRVYGRSVTHNFLHMDSVASIVPPRVTHLDPSAGEAVVSVWTGTADYVWQAMEKDHADRNLTPQVLADRYITADGLHGRLADLLAGGGPIVIVVHWQSLYSNGLRLGLRTFREVVSRINSLWKEKVAWRKISDIANQHLASSTVTFQAESGLTALDVTANCAFPTDLLTVTIPTPWPLLRGPRVAIDGAEIDQVDSVAQLRSGKWVMRGSVVTVSLPIARGRPAKISISTETGGAGPAA